MSKSAWKPTVGDVFDVLLSDGMHVAAVVLRVTRRIAVYGILDYYSEDPATMVSDGVRRLYTVQSGVLAGRHVMRACNLERPEGDHLGRVDGLEEDYDLGGVLGGESGQFCNRMAEGVYWDRLRRTDPKRAKVEWAKRTQRVRKEELARRRARAAKQGPGRLMKEDRFWSLLAPGDDWSEDPEGAADACVERLAGCSASQILLFEKTLTHRLFQLDTKAHAEVFAAGGYLSPDAFLYARCAVVAAGPTVFECVLQIPSTFPPDADLEDLLQVAPRAYEQVTGEDLEPTWDLSYETGSNVIGWGA